MTPAAQAALSSPAAQAGEAAYFACRDVHSYYGESYVVQGVDFASRM